MLNEAEFDVENYAHRGEFYPRGPKAEAEKILGDQHISSRDTKAGLNKCHYYSFKIFLLF